MVRPLLLFLFSPSLIASPAWVAITDNEDYIKLAGVAKLVRTPEHKQEIVAGNIAEFLKLGK